MIILRLLNRSARITILWLIAILAEAEGFSLTLEGGMLYGPGNLGVHRLQPGKIHNFLVTAPLTGHVEMFNNAGEKPNIFAETLHVTEVDGKLSDGTLINENIDVGFVLTIAEPETKQEVQLFVCSVSEEAVIPDENGNIEFALTAGFDPGLPDYVVKMDVAFVTGVGRLPLSERTRRGLAGGHDNADQFSSGHARVGKLGDFDNDGMLDGEFILAGNAPFDLIIAEGDPILVVRPFSSDIPVSAANAALYTVKGVTRNYPEVLFSSLNAKKDTDLLFYAEDLKRRMQSLKKNIERIPAARRSLSQPSATERNDKRSLKSSASEELDNAISEIEKITALQQGSIQTRDKLVRKYLHHMQSLEQLISQLQ